MGWAPETTTRPRVAPVEHVGTICDAALDGEPLMLAWTDEQTPGYAQVSEEIGIEQTSTSDDISENKLSRNEFWRSMRDFQGGLGQQRFDVPNVSADNAYRESTTVDTRVPGQLTLARATTVDAPPTFSVGDLHASDQASDGIWFISRTADPSTQAVTHYDLSTFTTKTLATGSYFRDLSVGPDDTCWIGSDNGIYYVTKAGSITAWTVTDLTKQAKVLCAAKHRLFWGGRDTANNADAFYEIATEGSPPVASTQKLLLAPGMRISDIKEAGALILFSVNLFNFSLGASSVSGAGRLYAYDGTNAPSTVLVLPPGEEIAGIFPVLGGSQVLLFVRRNDTAGNIRAVLYVLDVSGTQVANPRIAFEYPSSYTVWHTREAISLGQFVFFAGPYDASRGVGAGIDAYNVITGTVSHHLTSPTVSSSAIRQITATGGRLVYAQDQSGSLKLVIASTSTYVASAELVTSTIDLNVDAPKTWTVVEAGCKPLAAGQRIDVYYTADDPSAGDWRLVGSLHPGQTSQAWPLNVTSTRIALRVVLVAPASPTSTPTLTKLGVAAQLARLPKRTHNLRIQAYPQQQGLDDRPLGGASHDYYARLQARLDGLRDAGEVVWFQPPGSRYDGHAEQVKVGAAAKRLTGNPADGFGGVIDVALHNVNPDRRNLWPLSVASYPSLPLAVDLDEVYEAVGSAVLSASAAGTSWTAGPGTIWPVVTPTTSGDGVRAPAAHTSVPWRALAARGLPLSAGVLVRPDSAGLSVALSLEARNSADTIVQTTTGPTFTFTSAGVWLPVWVEGVSLDALTDATVYLTAKLIVQAGSTITPFGIDGWQLEQSRTATRWQAPPSNF